MLSIAGRPGATCDGVSRREMLRVGGAGLLGVSLGQLLASEARAEAIGAKKRDGFASAKNFIFVFLQGGPTHPDIWDPKPDAPDNIRSDFQPLKTKLTCHYVSETMANLAHVLERT